MSEILTPEVVRIFKMIQEMRDKLKNRWNTYKSFALQGGKIDSNTLEIKVAEDKTCERIQKEISSMFKNPEELNRITKGAT